MKKSRSNNLTPAQIRLIGYYRKKDQGLKSKFSRWKMDAINRESMLFIGIIIGALLTGVIWTLGFKLVFLPLLNT